MSLTQIGILFDIVGALILAHALSFPSLDLLIEKASTQWGYNREMLYGLCEQRVDARVGLAMIISGFLMQIFGQSIDYCPDGIKLLLISLFFLWCIGYAIARDLIVGRDFATARNKAEPGTRSGS